MELISVALSVVALIPAAVSTVWAVGDGGVSGADDDAVAARIQQEGLDHFLYLGDVYESGTAQEYATNYQTSFGRFKSITSPTPGNHEWPRRAEGYDPYWGSRVRQPDGGHHYSFDIGGWHVVSLNSEDSSTVERQRQWLVGDLARYSGTCTIAFWHRPRYNAGRHGEALSMDPLYDTLSGHAVALLTGHDHNYQRYPPFQGIAQFVVGTGGNGHYPVNESDSRLAASNDTAFGALRMELGDTGMRYEFVRTDGARLDSGTLPCTPHGQQGTGPPSVSIDRPRTGATYGLGPLKFAGRSSSVTALRATLLRYGGGTSSHTVTVRERWSLKLPSRLGRGRWKFTIRGTGPGGRSAASIRFKVRR